MSWTYTGPLTSPQDEVRFHCGDTDASKPLLNDGEIAYCLTLGTSPLAASVIACEAIQAKLSRLADESVGSVSVSFSQQAAGYVTLAATLERRIAKSSRMRLYAGGISRLDKVVTTLDYDRVRPSFSKHMMERRGGQGAVVGGVYIGSTGYEDAVDD